jgi:hypothetical protein
MPDTETPDAITPLMKSRRDQLECVVAKATVVPGESDESISLTSLLPSEALEAWYAV